jgi:GNAT superfamily N-acetyltransferase
METQVLVIRDAVLSDMQTLVRLLKQLFSIEKDFSFDAARQEKGLTLMLEGCKKHRTIKVACYNNHIIGMCSIQTRVSTANGCITAVVEDLVVDSDYRGAGIGEKLLNAIYSWARKRGIKSLQLLADKSNIFALCFYERQKWETTNLICLTKQL